MTLYRVVRVGCAKRDAVAEHAVIEMSVRKAKVGRVVEEPFT